MSVPGWPTAFRGSHAVAAGLVTPDRLRGPRFLRLLPDVYCRATAEPPGLLLRSLAAYRLVEGRGVLSGHSAAALLDAECAPRRGTPAEVTLLRGNLRAHPGLVVRRGLLRHDEITHVRDVACTTPLRTAFDLARGADRDAAVVAVDRLANRHRFDPDRLLELHARYRGRRGVAGVPTVVALSSPYAESPMETRLRLLVVAAGLPRPEVQWVVQDVVTRTAFWLDLAWPERRIGIEYEGEPHTEPSRVLRDIARHTRLVDLGWQVYRYTKREVYGDRPDRRRAGSCPGEMHTSGVSGALNPAHVHLVGGEGCPLAPSAAARVGWAHDFDAHPADRRATVAAVARQRGRGRLVGRTARTPAGAGLRCPMATPPALLFDLDGTLIDSVYQHVLAWQEALTAFGVDLAVWKIHRRIGMSGGLFVNALVRETGGALSPTQARELGLAHAEAFGRRRDTVRPLPGAAELLATLTDEGVPWAIATSGLAVSARPALALLGLPEDTPLVTRDQVRHAKPDPDLFLAAADLIDVAIGRAIVVGDSIWDLLAARRAGALGVGLLSGGYGREELERAGAYRVYADPAELLAHLDEIGVRRD